ncbi:MAG TPA: response regulator [Myxococcaceae bacterium]|jgi:response regulator RpfG family c-di-GMP phosphodiesterase
MSPSALPAVLYCDDDALCLQAFDRSFSQHFRIFPCASPQEALAVLEQRSSEIGAVISDQRMPGMSGVELLERARTLAPDARRMLVTAYADLKAMVDAVNRGQVSRCFFKPWDRAEVLASLEEALKFAQLELKLRELERQMVETEHQAGLGQELAHIAHVLTGPVDSLAPHVAALRQNVAPVIQYVNKHLAQDNDQAVAEIVKDLPLLISDMETGHAHLRQVAQGLKVQARGSALSG